MTSSRANTFDSRALFGRPTAAGTVAVVASAKSVETSDAIVAALADASFDAVARVVSRHLVEQLTIDDPDAIVVVHAPESFDLVRLCRDLSGALGCGIIVVLTESTAARPGLGGAFEVEVLDAGADHVVGRAAAGGLLAALVRVVIRNRPRSMRQPAPIVVGDVIIDPDGYVLRIAGEVVKVRPLHFQLLAVLARQVGNVVGRDELLREVWGVRPDDVDPRRLRIAISGLRRILGSAEDRPRIESVARFGYRLTRPSPA